MWEFKVTFAKLPNRTVRTTAMKNEPDFTKSKMTMSDWKSFSDTPAYSCNVKFSKNLKDRIKFYRTCPSVLRISESLLNALMAMDETAIQNKFQCISANNRDWTWDSSIGSPTCYHCTNCPFYRHGRWNSDHWTLPAPVYLYGNKHQNLITLVVAYFCNKLLFLNCYIRLQLFAILKEFEEADGKTKEMTDGQKRAERQKLREDKSCKKTKGSQVNFMNGFSQV